MNTGTKGRRWIVAVCILWLSVPAFAEQKTVTKTHQDTNGFFVIKFDYDDSWFSRPATMPEGVPHYDAKITVFRVIDGKTVQVCEPWRGVFTDGQCFEDNLSDIVGKALKTTK
ncbi:MAG: hypothetical protein WC455_20375 [Dehalococcoidia bacterium]